MSLSHAAPRPLRIRGRSSVLLQSDGERNQSEWRLPLLRKEMKRLLFGFLLGIGLSWLQPVKAQDVETHATHDLTVKEIVSILADYDFYHVAQQPFFHQAFGVTNFESYPPAVWIFNTGDTPSREATVIHELTHVHWHQQGLDPPEEFIAAEEARQYQKLFGGEK